MQGDCNVSIHFFPELQWLWHSIVRARGHKDKPYWFYKKRENEFELRN